MPDSITSHLQPQSAFSGLVPSVLVPGPKIAARWCGALERRLNRMPLETLLRAHRQRCSTAENTALDENLTVATAFLLTPSLTHTHDWQQLVNPAYFIALGRVVGTVSYCLASLIMEPQAWRVTALRATARLLSPVLGPDAAPQTAADVVGSFGSTLGSALLESPLGQHVARALASCDPADLTALRQLATQELAQSTLPGLRVFLLTQDERIPAHVAANT